MGKIVGITYEPKEKQIAFKCPICSKEYKTQDGLDKHIIEKHPNTEE